MRLSRAVHLVNVRLKFASEEKKSTAVTSMFDFVTLNSWEIQVKVNFTVKMKVKYYAVTRLHFISVSEIQSV